MPRALGDPFRPRRRATRVVRVGDVEIGGDNPIRIQSMTNTDTMDTVASVEQITRLAEAGCEIVRVTAPSIRDAENLRVIRDELTKRRVRVPLVADIHFTPNAALIAADVVEKVRINPGNYADKKKFEVREYDDAAYAAEIDRVSERFRPLVRRCKENGVAMRIGTNHGSLSDRVLNRFGDTPAGMVESALEFLDVCEDEHYYDVVFSMKSSNTQVAIQAYRTLAARLEERDPGGISYPFHVGVTEAGDAEDGRIKSAIGIGSLLEDGLGDTIRVSLTEDPVREVPVARAIAQRAETRHSARGAESPDIDVASKPVPNPFAHERRKTIALDWQGLEVGAEAPVRVELELEDALNEPAAVAARLALELTRLRDVECESLLVGARDVIAMRGLETFRKELNSLGLVFPLSVRADPGADGMLTAARSAAGVVARWVVPVTPESVAEDLVGFARASQEARVGLEWELSVPVERIPEWVHRLVAATAPVRSDCAYSLDPMVPLHDYRVLASALSDADAAMAPIVLRHRLEPGETLPAGLSGADGVPEAALLDASIRLGSLLCDGIGDVLSIQSRIAAAPSVDLAYRVLQGARLRTTRTEFISCPSCGRTLFDLEETTARIKARTDHLRGVKIAIMGCIVNGPGEMADADFGYVGSGVGQVTLYVGHQVVARAVPENEAPDRLVDLIREHGRWIDAGEDAAAASNSS